MPQMNGINLSKKLLEIRPDLPILLCTGFKEAVREIKRVKQEVFMPLVHRPGEAQVDFGFAVAKTAGVLRKFAFFVMVLPHSDAFFVMAFERECTETYWEGHMRSFEFFGGVPTTPLFEKESDLNFNTFISNLPDPSLFHRRCARPCLASDDDPVDTSRIKIPYRAKEGFKRDELNGSGRIKQVVDPV